LRLAFLFLVSLTTCGTCDDGALDPEGCANTKGCTVMGTCGKRDGKCMATDEGCRTARVCTQHGRCHAHMSGECEAISNDDCKKSQSCRLEGRCKLSKGTVDVPRACTAE
jgi:hypothetical protein